ncbi:MAG: glycosyltransferase family A protein, partial [Helicobacter sp.]|nr:glycosyltransferase family 2 protein [Helicobacter sp.]MDD7568198.1 glycosyltransferase family A protein [Helicobacter sp.]MDY5740865.1 glycosyltransferase family A protein [Helicobacter sp.]
MSDNQSLQESTAFHQSIGVVIPIYNVAPYLRECLDSVINQTYKNLHVVL